MFPFESAKISSTVALSLAALGLPAVGCQLNQEIVEIVGVVVDGGAAVVLLGSQFSTVQYVNTQVNVGD